MKKVNNSSDKRPVRTQPPGLTVESRQDQLIALAVDLAEKQLMEGTASTQVITHYLRLGSTKQRLEKEKLQKQNELLRAKTQALKSAKEVQSLYAQALQAMRSYGGTMDESEDDDNLEQ